MPDDVVTLCSSEAEAILHSIRFAQKRFGYTQLDIAKLCGWTSDNHLSAYKRGNAVMPEKRRDRFVARHGLQPAGAVHAPPGDAGRAVRQGHAQPAQRRRAGSHDGGGGMNLAYHPTHLREITPAKASTDPQDAAAHFCHFCHPRLIVATHWDVCCDPQVPCCNACGGRKDRRCRVPHFALRVVA